MSVSIGKALLERSAINAKIADLVTRITNNAITEKTVTGETEQTVENSEELLNQVNILDDRHVLITRAIINANYETKVNYENIEYKLVEIIDLIEVNKRRMKRIKDLIATVETNTITTRRTRYDTTDKKYISTVDIAELRKTNEKLAQKNNALQVILQEANWATQINY
jgi:hypothetical protein